MERRKLRSRALFSSKYLLVSPGTEMLSNSEPEQSHHPHTHTHTVLPLFLPFLSKALGIPTGVLLNWPAVPLSAMFKQLGHGETSPAGGCGSVSWAQGWSWAAQPCSPHSERSVQSKTSSPSRARALHGRGKEHGLTAQVREYSYEAWTHRDKKSWWLADSPYAQVLFFLGVGSVCYG